MTKTDRQTTTPHTDDNSFLIRDVRIFDGVQVTGTGSVLVLEGRITEIGIIAEVPALPEYDGTGKTVLPGLIDCHTHSLYGRPRTDRRDALRFGVTTELDLHGDPAVLAAARRQRRSLERTDQADLWSAGIGVAVPGGTPPNYPGLPHPPRLAPDANPEQFVTDRIHEGSDFIKVFLDGGSVWGQPTPTPTRKQVHAVVAAAHRRGLMVIAHATEHDYAALAIAAGVDGLAHTILTPIDDDLIADIVEGGAFVTATLSSFDGGLGARDLYRDPRVRPYLSETQTTALTTSGEDPDLYHRGSLNVRRLHAAGVPIFAGADSGVGAETEGAHGATMMAELSHLVAAGLTPTEVLTAATAAPAQRYQLADRGRIVTDMRADLVLVNGDPTVGVTAIRDIATIWKNGYVIDRTPN
ncbi:amidohydrolase family protein [Sciscionella marina]|uniref:amidohydrolase family protein n=1 Tax=Sciscionella marina TaxID=508770 RepID=UPI001F09B0B5|nr:amidohydrolase family protein [Sciscionella marina]